MAMPPSRPLVRLSECFHFCATRRSTRTASRVTSAPIPSPGNTKIFRFIRCYVQVRIVAKNAYATSVRHRLLRLLLLRLADQNDNLFVHQPFFTVGQRRETTIEIVQLFPRERESKILAALIERMPP